MKIFFNQKSYKKMISRLNTFTPAPNFMFFAERWRSNSCSPSCGVAIISLIMFMPATIFMLFAMRWHSNLCFAAYGGTYLSHFQILHAMTPYHLILIVLNSNITITADCDNLKIRKK